MAHFVEDAAKFYDKNYHDLIIIHVCDKMGLHPVVGDGDPCSCFATECTLDSRPTNCGNDEVDGLRERDEIWRTPIHRLGLHPVMIECSYRCCMSSPSAVRPPRDL